MVKTIQPSTINLNLMAALFLLKSMELTYLLTYTFSNY